MSGELLEDCWRMSGERLEDGWRIANEPEPRAERALQSPGPPLAAWQGGRLGAGSLAQKSVPAIGRAPHAGRIQVARTRGVRDEQATSGRGWGIMPLRAGAGFKLPVAVQSGGPPAGARNSPNGQRARHLHDSVSSAPPTLYRILISTPAAGGLAL